MQRRKALQAWAAQSCGFMGRSPDHLASALVGQRMGIEVFRKHSAERAKALADYFDYARSNDLFPHLRDHQSAGRARQGLGRAGRRIWSRASSMRIRAASPSAAPRCSAPPRSWPTRCSSPTCSRSSRARKTLAFSCALPMNAKGLRVLSRKSYEAHAVSVFDNPLSSRFDENDALMYFDDVKVPWERVFVYRDTDMCRAQFHDTPGHAYQNYQAQIRLSVKIAFLAGLAHRVTEAIGTTNMPPCASSSACSRRRSAWSTPCWPAWRPTGSHARRIVGAEQALHVFGAGADPGPLSARHQHASASSPAAR